MSQSTVELTRAEEGSVDQVPLAGKTPSSSDSSDESKSRPRASLTIGLKIFGVFLLSVVGFLVVYFFVFHGDDGESNVVHLDDSNTDLDGLNTYFTNLKANFAASPSQHATYSNMAPEGTPMMSGLEPADFAEKIKEKFPEIAKLEVDRYIVSANALNQDKDAKWGLLRANVRGHAGQSILLSPDQLKNVQHALTGVDDDDVTNTDDASPSTDDTSPNTNDDSPSADDDTTSRKLKSVSAAGTFNWAEAMTALYHAETCYCEEDTYLHRTFAGPLSGFVATYHITNPRFDTAGYIGYHTGERNIYVSFRGSASLNNWITTNLDVDSDPYDRCEGCRAHSGFLEAALAVFPNVLAEVKRLRAIYPSYKVVVTGHSLGGALSHITALELEANINNVELYTFGCPRVTNTALAAYSTEKFPTASRVTHDKDLVVHTPGSIFYTHMAGEWHQPDDDVEVIECFGYEDDNCSYQYIFTSIDDHMEYLGVEMGEGGCAAVTYD